MAFSTTSFAECDFKINELLTNLLYEVKTSFPKEMLGFKAYKIFASDYF